MNSTYIETTAIAFNPNHTTSHNKTDDFIFNPISIDFFRREYYHDYTLNFNAYTDWTTWFWNPMIILGFLVIAIGLVYILYSQYFTTARGYNLMVPQQQPNN